MLSRQSSASPATLALARSRSTIASSAAISSGLLLCSTSQLFFWKSRKLTVASDQEDFFAFQHARQEMVFGGELRAKVRGHIDRRVDLAADGLLRSAQCFGYLRK